jgi:biopolymer transport protein ExbD
MTRNLSLALCLFAAVSLPAQRARLVQPPTPQTPATTEKPPYTATIVTTTDLTLADGNTIHREETETRARDSQGRTRIERPIMATAGSVPVKTMVTVMDPVSKTMTVWVVGSGVAKVHSMNRPESAATSAYAAIAGGAPTSESVAPRAHDDVKMEQLGTREIQGVQATGRRTTRTIPAGEEGNSEPIVSTRETWQSHALGLTLLAVSESPKDGKRVSQVTELQQSEPDAALFQPPADYTVKDEQ